MKCKKMYMVLCRLVDGEEDFGLFPLCGDNDKPMEFSRVADARKAMKKDYERFAEDYDAAWTIDGTDHCKRSVGANAITIDVPVWDGENGRDSWIRAKWKIVSL